MTTEVYTPDHARDQAMIDAMVKANGDRGRLARLRRAKTARRHDGKYELAHPEVARPFVRDIEERAKPDINLAIRSKKKPPQKRRRR